MKALESELPPRLEDLLERFRDGKRVGLARAISLVEDERDGFQAFLHAALAEGLRGRRVGLTGPPGAGKSTLLAALATSYREQDDEVGVVAVDPTSPYSGGALLGDRIRMNDLTTDPGIFIRSMATRGSLGGLATTTREVLDLMDAFGFPRLLVETVGVGQTELEITGAADTVVVVLVPESGDAIQAMKAGLMEIADVFVVNKADRPGADRLAREIGVSLHLRAGETLRNVPAHHGVDLKRAGKGKDERKRAAGREAASSTGSAGSGGSLDASDSGDASAETGDAGSEPAPPVSAETPDAAAAADSSADAPESAAWEIPVVKTVAQSGEGLDALMAAIDAHRAHLEVSGELARRRRTRAWVRIRDVVDRELRRRAREEVGDEEALADALDRIATGDETPYSVAREILERL